jgi:glyoxylase-like metal-dependent hydrolase (beta-lactamase superfamily II)
MKIEMIPIGSIGTNCYIAWDEKSKECFVVDPADDAPQVRAIIEREGLRVKYVVLTHGHGDHIGGVKGLLSEFPDAKLAAGAKELSLLGNASINYTPEILGRSVELEPDIKLSEGDELTVGSEILRVIETPGHTPGGISILTDDGKALFSGDTLFRASIGRTDLPGGDYAVLIQTIREKLFVLPDDVKVYPGHMEDTTIGLEKEYNPFV